MHFNELKKHLLKDHYIDTTFKVAKGSFINDELSYFR